MKFRRFVAVFLLIALLSNPILVSHAYAIDSIDIDARAALLVDADSGAILYEKNAHTEMSIASITKVMTALLVLEAVDRGELKLDQEITVSASAVADLPYDGSNADPELVPGEIMTVENLLFCMIMISANEACNVLAEAVSGSITAFVDSMNARAQELGCENTHFANTNGLTAPGHYSSAWDVSVICREAMKNDEFLYICSATWKNVPATNKADGRTLHTTNSLLDSWRYSGYQYPYAKGIKTGSTEDAGHCLASYAVRDGRTLVSVILGAQKVVDENGTDIRSFSETVRLFDWGFENFSSKIILDKDEMIQEVPVALSKETDYVVVHPAYTTSSMLPNDVDASAVEREIQLESEVINAPIVAEQQLGTITLRYNGNVCDTVPLLAVSDVNASRFLIGKAAVEAFFAQPVVKMLIVLGILFIIALVLVIRFYRRNRRYGRLHNRNRGRRSYRGRRFR